MSEELEATPLADLEPGDRITVNSDLYRPRRICTVVEVVADEAECLARLTGAVIYDCPVSPDGEVPAHRSSIGDPRCSGVRKVEPGPPDPLDSADSTE